MTSSATTADEKIPALVHFRTSAMTRSKNILRDPSHMDSYVEQLLNVTADTGSAAVGEVGARNMRFMAAYSRLDSFFSGVTSGTFSEAPADQSTSFGGNESMPSGLEQMFSDDSASPGVLSPISSATEEDILATTWRAKQALCLATCSLQQEQTSDPNVDGRKLKTVSSLRVMFENVEEPMLRGERQTQEVDECPTFRVEDEQEVERKISRKTLSRKLAPIAIADPEDQDGECECPCERQATDVKMETESLSEEEVLKMSCPDPTVARTRAECSLKGNHPSGSPAARRASPLSILAPRENDYEIEAVYLIRVIGESMNARRERRRMRAASETRQAQAQAPPPIAASPRYRVAIRSLRLGLRGNS